MVIVYINELNINCNPSVGTREVTRNHSCIQLKPELQPASRWNSLEFITKKIQQQTQTRDISFIAAAHISTDQRESFVYPRCILLYLTVPPLY